MLLSSFIAGYSSLALASAAAVVPSVARREASANKGLKMDFDVLVGNSIHDASPHNKPMLSKRADGSVSYEITNMANYYQVSVQMGSNKDVCKVLLDTGSSYLWVMEQDVQCEKQPVVTGQLLAVHKRETLDGLDGTGVGEVETAAETIADTAAGVATETAAGIATETAAGVATDTAAGVATDTAAGVATDTAAGTATETAAGTAAGTADTLSIPYPVISGISAPSLASGSVDGAVQGGTCTALGSFDTAGSDSFHLVESAPVFSISYVDQSSAVGVWANDTVGFADSSVQLSFGVVDESSSDVGILGIGPYAYGDQLNSTSNNFPIQLKEQGIIDKVAYSLYLNQNSSSTGSVLFGAVDHKKYSGQLQTVPMVSMYEEYDIIDSFAVALDAIYLQGNKQNVTVLSEPIAAILDSGTTLSALPQSVIDSLAASFSAKSQADGSYEVDCAYSKNSGDIVFDFSGIHISVPVEQLLLEQGGKCYLAVQSLSTPQGMHPYALLGDNVLRNAYVVYDLEASEISLAQASYTDDEDVEAISSTVPSAVQAARYSSTALASSVSEETSAKFKSPASKSHPSAMMLALVLGMLCCGAML